MVKIKNARSRVLSLVAVILAMGLFLGIYGFISPVSDFDSVTVKADNTNVTVTLKDLMDRHGVYYAIGPIKETVKDGITYNNEYEIPSDRYFDANSYLYTTNSGKTLVGWKKGIKKAGSRILDQDGTDHDVPSDTTVYIHDTQKYAIVVPDEITVVGTSGNICDTIMSSAAYTDFGYYFHNYSISSNLTSAQKGEYWQPRERLGGVYFSNNSNLTQFADASINRKPHSGLSSSGTYPAFNTCDSMRFMRLPVKAGGGFTTIGAGAFSNCQQLRDVNIPETVTTLGDSAFQSCSALSHITIPSSVTSAQSNSFMLSSKLHDVENHSSALSEDNFANVMNYYTSTTGSQLYAVGNSETDKGEYAFYFCKSQKSGAYAAGINQPAGRWYAIGLAGLEDKNRTTIYKMPETVVAGGADDRRKSILYDYLNPDGTGHKNVLSENIESYDIVDNMCESTWLGNLIIPKTVKIIGNTAFSYSHIQYVEIGSGVTTIGKQAFWRNTMGAGSELGTMQYFYIHGNPNVVADAFDKRTNDSDYSDSNGRVYERTFIFENKTLYDYRDKFSKYGPSSTDATFRGTDHCYYQIPIKAVVESQDGNVTLDNSDMSALFSNDSDYQNGSYKDSSGNVYNITYTKRLSDHNYNYVKKENGSWGSVTTLPSDPNLNEYKKTNWFSNNAYTQQTTASDAFTGRAGDEVSIYTKKIGNPSTVGTTKEKTYNGEEISPLAAAEFGDDYSAAITAYSDFSGNTGVQLPTMVLNAGTYTISAQLAEKWGVWSDEKAAQNSMTYKVNRAAVDLAATSGEEYNALIWTGSAGTERLGSFENLYYYVGEGWYSQPMPQFGEATRITDNAVNSTLNYNVSQSRYPKLQDTDYFTVTNFNVSPQIDSGEYNGTYTISLKDTNNYYFVYDNASAEFEKRNITVTGTERNETVATIRKIWYIIKQSNWLTNSESAGAGASAPIYAMVTRDSDLSKVNGWTYGEQGFTMHTPDVAYKETDENAVITFDLSADMRSGNDIKVTGKPISELLNFINLGMPAGTYTVSVHVSAYAGYSSIDQDYIITVAPRSIDGNIVDGINELLKNKKFENAFNNNALFLHNADLSNLLSTEMQLPRAYGGADSVWKSAEYDNYYEPLKISYNLDRMQTNAYYTEDVLNNTYPGGEVPRAVGQYTVYYSLFADNYVTVGGENADENRRDYMFNTVIFRYVAVPSVSNMTYTGSEVKPVVPYDNDSQFYSYDFPDSDYVNVRSGCKIEFTLLDSVLSRWQSTEEVSAIATVTFDITPATNKWIVAPQMFSWSYDGFAASVNTISGRLNFTDAEVVYNIGYYEEDETGGKNLVWIFENNFKTDDGRITDKSVIDKLNLLTPRDYVLGSWVQPCRRVGETDVYNVLGFETDSANYGSVRISKANNRWVKTPGISGWAWKDFNRDVNRFTGAALYPYAKQHAGLGEDETFNAFDYITFQIVRYNAESKKYVFADGFDGVTFNIDALGNVVQISGGEFTAEQIEAKFKALPRGEYYILATVESNENYYGINEGGIADINAADLDYIRFEVSKANNYWNKSPSITGWQYKNFNSAVNFVAGAPKYPEASAQVQYVIYKGNADPGEDYVSSDSDIIFTEMNGNIADKLNLLANGSYWLIATVAGTDDFTALRTAIPFSVISNNTNDWTVSASVTGWVYGSYNNSFTEAEAKFGNENILYTVSKQNAGGGYTPVDGFYVTDEIDSSKTHGITAETLIEKIAALGAGNYLLSVDVAATDDYAAVTDSIYFAVQKADNAWVDNVLPTIEGWTYNEDGISNNPVNAAPVQTAEVTSTYYKTTLSGGSLVLGDPLAGKPVDAGTYAYKTVVAATDNYKELECISYFTISQLENDWTTKPEEILPWTWGQGGDTIDNSNLVNAAVNIGDIKYVISLGNSYSEGYSQDAIAQKLKQLPAGTYKVTASVEGNGNYKGLEATTSVTVGQAAYTWVTAPVSSSWTWDGNTDADKTFVKPVAAGVDGETEELTYKYSVKFNNGDTREFTDFDTLKNYLFKGDAGDYTVTVTVSSKAGNYYDLSETVTVTVNKAGNRFTANEPAESMSGTFGELSAPATPTAYHGTVQYYTDGATAGSMAVIADLDAWLKGLKPSAAAYKLYTVVEGNGNYEGLKKTTNITVNAKDSAWTNADDLNSTYEFTYGDGLNDKLSTVVIPEYAEGVIHTVTYTPVVGEENTQNFTANELKAYFADSARGAGVYTVASSYTDESAENPVYLAYTMVITVKQTEVDWVSGTKPDTLWSFAYGAVNKNTPAVQITSTGITATVKVLYKLTGANGNVIVTGGDAAGLIDYLNTLNVGSYTLTVYTGEPNNIKQLSVTATIVISQATNDWTNGTAPQDNYSFTRGGAEDIIQNFPAAKYGTVIVTVSGTNNVVTAIKNSNGVVVDYKVVPESVSKQFGITSGADGADNREEINAFLRSLNAGTYNIEAQVLADASGNYSGLRVSSVYTVSKNANSWTKELNAKYEFTANSNGYNIELPTAQWTNGSDGVLFELSALAGNYTSSGMTAEELKNELKNGDFVSLGEGTYTLVAYVPGGADYENIRAAATVIISAAANSWTTAPDANKTWAWNKESADFTVPFTVPKAAYGEVMLTVTNEAGIQTQLADMTDAEILAYLKDLDAGSYRITAEVAATAMYGGITDVTIVTVNKVSTVFTNQSSLQNILTWIKGNSDNEDYVVPEQSWGEITFTVTDSNGSSTTVTDVNAYLKGENFAYGSYTITATVVGDVNHEGIIHTTAFTYSSPAKALNSLTNDSDKGTVKWTYGGENNKDIVLKTVELNETATFTVDGLTLTATENKLADLNAHLRTLDAGNHSITINADGNEFYESFTYTLILDIAKGANEWVGNLDIGDTLQGTANKGWIWGDTDYAFNLPSPKIGDRVIVTVSGNGNEFRVTLTFIENEGAVEISGEDKLKSVLGGLGVGFYTITAEIPESLNYSSPANKVITVEVAAAANSWKTEPEVNGWEYKADKRPVPTGGIPEKGNAADVMYKYYFGTGDGKTETETFNTAGTYTYVATLAGTDNYGELTYEGTFEITRAPDSWNIAPSAIGWTWNEFDANINRFMAQTKYTSRQVTFTVYRDEACTDKIAEFVTTDGVVTDTAAVNALKGLGDGTYWFKAEVEQNEQYAALGKDEKHSFKVEIAQNTWTEDGSPRITGWAQYAWKNANKPFAEAKYGNVTVIIEAIPSLENGGAPDTNAQGKKIFEGVIDRTTGKFVGEDGNTFVVLDKAEVGWYRMVSTSGSETGHYTGITAKTYFQVYEGSVARPSNYWTIQPSMDSWTAYDAAPSGPSGATYFGTVSYEYFGTKEENGRYVLDESKNYGQRVPEAPGKYIARLTSKNFDENNNELLGDRRVAEAPFEIYKRTDTWLVTPAIENWSLGGGNTGKPVGEAEYGKIINFMYKVRGMDDSTAVSELPTQPGEYTMIAVATDEKGYTYPLRETVDFTVSRSKIEWIELPVIEGWSEEFAPNLPKGSASVGEIKYTYRTSDGKILDKAPTTEGTYWLIATVEKEGYETLTAEYEFTITAAYDTTLLITDIVLGCVACAITVLVIIFAVRRYRQC